MGNFVLQIGPCSSLILRIRPCRIPLALPLCSPFYPGGLLIFFTRPPISSLPASFPLSRLSFLSTGAGAGSGARRHRQQRPRAVSGRPGRERRLAASAGAWASSAEQAAARRGFGQSARRHSVACASGGAAGLAAGAGRARRQVPALA
jgi:hypothetical protein